MRHFAYVPKKTKAGVVAEHVLELNSRGAAEKRKLTLLGREGAGAVVSIDGDLADGAIVPPDEWGRRPG